MTQDQILKDIEDMMRVVKQEKENLEKILANLEAAQPLETEPIDTEAHHNGKQINMLSIRRTIS